MSFATQHNHIVVAALYKFVSLPDFQRIRPSLLEVMNHSGVKGTLLLAEEGINGTVSGTRDAIDELLAWFKKDSRFSDLEYKESFCEQHPFYRTKVKLKKEIVTLGVEGVDPNNIVGAYVNAGEWNSLLNDPDVTVLDTRNVYEFVVGTFKGAINPDIKTFREFPNFVKQKLDPSKHKKIAMFCTGGIRCEKASSYMLQAGFEQVYHLKGGILKYIETIPKEESLWEGDCFVFDNRVAVDYRLSPGNFRQCHACRHPLSEQDCNSVHYHLGISCPYCWATLPEKTRRKAQERHKQILLAKERQEPLPLGRTMRTAK